MTWLVTGGAGYIGSHVVRAFQDAGHPVVVVDDLSTGHRSFVPEDVPFLVADVSDAGDLSSFLTEHGVTGVVHLAGFKFAGVSVSEPVLTYRANVQGTLGLLEAMAAAGADKIVFSSSAAVYGTPEVERVTEATPTRPESPYGESKLIGEWLLAAQGRATGLRHVSLRYFNVVGTSWPGLLDTSAHNLLPLVFDALRAGRRPIIFGDDYPTPDGTCVRDYVHVGDIAQAHVAAAAALEAGTALRPFYNLGSGEGTSVRQIMDSIIRVTGVDLEPEIRDRRPGDPARIVADGSQAAEDLGWQPSLDVDAMVVSAWRA